MFGPDVVEVTGSFEALVVREHLLRWDIRKSLASNANLCKNTATRLPKTLLMNTLPMFSLLTVCLNVKLGVDGCDH